jgi:hypothetical protein
VPGFGRSKSAPASPRISGRTDHHRRGDRLEFARERLAQEALLQHFESAGVDPHDAADSGFAQQCLDMRAGFDEGGDEELSANAAVWREARVVVAVTLGVDVHRVEIVLDMP